jgi:hypothetical protein
VVIRRKGRRAPVRTRPRSRQGLSTRAAHQPEIAAKPTVYRGIRLRSRLEARWAGVLDAAGLVWLYEPDVVDVGKWGLYRPDFWLPAQRTWLEVKGPHMDRAEKTRALARKLGRDGQVLMATVAGVCWRVPASGRPSQAEVHVGRCGSCGQLAVGVPEQRGMGRLRCRDPKCERWAVPDRVLGW